MAIKAAEVSQADVLALRRGLRLESRHGFQIILIINQQYQESFIMLTALKRGFPPFKAPSDQNLDVMRSHKRQNP